MRPHIIHQKKVEISSRDEKKSSEIFTEISRLFNNRVRDVTNRLFDKYGNDEVLMRIELLELDMGNVIFPFSEEDFIKVYSEKLDEALSNLFKKQWKSPKSQEENGSNVIVKTSLIQLLEQFLFTGTIAWWADKDEFKDNVMLFANLLENEEADLKEMIERNFSKSNVRKRLVYSFTEENVRAVINFIQPLESKYIFQYHTEVSDLQQKSRIVSSENIEFRKTLWLFILDFLAEHSGSRFNKKMFVRSTVKSIADKFSMSFDEVLFYFAAALNNIPENYKKTENLVNLIEEISFEYQKQNDFSEQILGVKSEKKKNALPLISEHPLFFYLINGFFPFDSVNTSKVSINSDLINVINRNETYSRLFFLKYGKGEDVRKRLVTNFEEETVKTVVKLVEPASYETIVSYTEFTTHFQKKTSFVKTEEKVFKQSLWSLVLTYLFSDRGSVFNAKMFLISNIQGLSQHYNIDYRHLLAILVQGVGQQSNTALNQVSLFYLLTEILAENKKLSVSNEGISDIKPDNIEQKEINNELFQKGKLTLSEILENKKTESDSSHKKFMLSAFLYLLEFGDLPWWAGSEKPSVFEFINKGRKLYLNEFKKGFVYAIQKGRVGVNFIEKHSSLFKTDLIFLFENHPLLEQFILFLNKLNTLAHIGLSSYSLDVLFAKSLIRSSFESSDENLNLVAFFSSFFSEIEKQQGIKAKENVAIESWKFILQNEYKQLKNALGKAEKEYPYLYPLSTINYSDENFKQALQFSIINVGAIPTTELTSYLTKLIIHYAKYRKFPNEIKIVTILSEKEFLVWMHEYLYRNQRNELTEIFSTSKLNSIEQQFLLDVLQSHSMKLGVRDFIEPLVQKFLLNDIAYKESALVNFNSWNLLIQLLKKEQLTANLQLKWISLFKLESSKILISQHINDNEVKFIFEKFGRSELTFWYEVFTETFYTLEIDHFERHQLRKWILEFFLEFLSGQIVFDVSIKILSNQFAKFLFLKTKGQDQKLVKKLKEWDENKSGVLFGNAKDLIHQLHISIKRLVKNKTWVKSLEEKVKSDEQKLHFILDPDDKKRMEDESKKRDVLEEEEKEKEKEEPLPLEERVYIRNAGMILLHPFISTLFSRSNLIKERTFVDEVSQAEAIRLLQFATTGTEEALEHELILNKILVGMQPEDVIVGNNLLREDQKELINGMMNAVLLQWDKMKNTSVEGFRNSFLIREGYIFRTEEEWVLRVEKRAYDILLETLPWSFGMIKFSWMNKPIIVEWI